MSFFGKINPPAPLSHFGTSGGQALANFLSLGLKLIFILAGLYVFLQFILAGWVIIASSGDPKRLASARDKILWSLVGLTIVLGAWALIVIVEQMIGFCLGFRCPLQIIAP